MSAENFLKNLTAGFPATLKSADSENVYHLIAEKDGAKLGVSAVLEPGYPAKYKGGKVRSIAIVLRLIVTGETNPFASLKTRANAKFLTAEGDPVFGLRADKLYLPVTYWPVGPAELMQAIKDQNVYGRLALWIKTKVLADGGTMLFGDVTVEQALASKFENVPTDTLHLFVLPGDEGAAEQDGDAVQAFKDSTSIAPDTPKLAGPADAPKDVQGLIDEGMKNIPDALKGAVGKKLGIDPPSDGPNILPGGDTDSNADPDDEQ